MLLRHSKVHLFSLALKHHPRADGTILLDCFRASLDVVQHVVNELQGKSNLRYMVNNISAMCLCRSSPLQLLPLGSDPRICRFSRVRGKGPQFLQICQFY